MWKGWTSKPIQGGVEVATGRVFNLTKMDVAADPRVVKVMLLVQNILMQNELK